jgi:hypothetical protein
VDGHTQSLYKRFAFHPLRMMGKENSRHQKKREQ